MRVLFASTAAVAALLALGACHKNAAPATATSDAAAASDAMATNAMAASDAGTSDAAVNGAQDATAGAVGMASASTAGAVSTDAFVSNAAQSDMYEIQAAKIAQQKSSNADIKAFAAKMIKDHTASTAKIKAAVAKSGAKVTPPAGLDNRRQGLIDNLKAAKPGDFDKEYVSQQVAAHNEALTLMKGYANHGDTDALKTAAGEIAPTVQMHLDMIKKIQDGMKS